MFKKILLIVDQNVSAKYFARSQLNILNNIENAFSIFYILNNI